MSQAFSIENFCDPECFLSRSLALKTIFVYHAIIKGKNKIFITDRLYCRSVSGFQMMYADSYMTQEEFRAMFDHQLYDR